jgi:outer membrane protein TolC
MDRHSTVSSTALACHRVFGVGLLALFVQSASAQGLGLSQAVAQLLENAPRNQAARADLGAAEDKVQEVSRRAWMPQLELNASAGYQRYDKPNAELHEVSDAQTYSARVTQLVSDFGRSAKSIEENRRVRDQSAAGLEAMRQGVALDGILAYLSVQRAAQVLDFAVRSERNIIEQARIEDALVEAGRGYVSNVLQAKAQLAGTQARRVRAEGAQSVAQYRIQAVFGEVAPKMSFGERVPMPSPLPASLDAALAEADQASLQLRIGRFRSEALTARMESIHAREYLPRVQVLLESRRTTGFDGVKGTVADDRAQIQFNLPFNLGMAGNAAVRGAQRDVAASSAREAETRNLVREQVAIAWRNLQTAQGNRFNLDNQVRLAQEFLNIAREERKVGKRSLLDVLSAETNLLNAQSDLVSTEFDVLSAAYTLLQAVGRLDSKAVVGLLAQKRS